MKKTLVVLTLLIGILIGCQSPKYINTFSNKEIATHINLEYKRKLFFVDLYVNGKKGKFLVDSGASLSVLDINQADKYGFICISNGRKLISGIKGDVLEFNVRKAHYNTEDGKMVLYTFKACDLSHVVENMKKDNVEIVGVIGSDYLMNANAIINYKTKTLDLYNF